MSWPTFCHPGHRIGVKDRVAKADQATWEKATQAATSGCPISRGLNTTITMQVRLKGRRDAEGPEQEAGVLIDEPPSPAVGWHGPCVHP